MNVEKVMDKRKNQFECVEMTQLIFTFKSANYQTLKKAI